MQQITKRAMGIVLGLLLVLGGFSACQKSAEVGEDAYAGAEQDTQGTSQDKANEISTQFTPTVVRDITQIRKMRLWLEYFYYNNIFDQNINNDTGAITEDAMMSFAASYIMQIENKGLRFDTDTFRLYIPQKVMEEVVERFFDYKIQKHHSLSKHGILYDKENYVIQAEAREWATRLDVLMITEIRPQVFLAILNGNNTEIGEVEHQVKAEFQVVADRFVLKKYQMITDKEAFTTGNPIDTDNAGEPVENREGADNITNPESEGESEPTPTQDSYQNGAE